MAKLAAELEGNRMDDLASMGRFGDTMVAHINPQEAQMLIDKGGAGTINPMTGLPEFYFDDPGYSTDADMSGAEGDTSDTSGIGEYDDSDAGQAGPMPDTPALSPATVDEIADFYGFGSPTEGVAGAQEGFKGFGDPDLGGFYSSGTATQLLKERLNKPGGMTKAEQLLYTQLLNTGLIGSEAMAKMAELLATPGVAAAVESGYSEGYQYGGILGDALAAQEDALGAISDQIKKAEKKIKEQDKEDEEPFDEPGEFTTESKDYFGDLLGDLVGGIKDYFTGPPQDDLNLMSEAVKQAGYTFSPISDELKMADFALSRAPGFGLVKAAYDIPAFLTGSRIIGDVDTPYGTFQLTESGDLTAPDMSEDMSDFGNQPVITERRKAATQPVKKEEEKEEEEKDYFPEVRLPRLTESGLKTLQYTLRNDPEALQNIYNTYALPEQYSGLKALV